jgi:hypothetical protein
LFAVAANRFEKFSRTVFLRAAQADSSFESGTRPAWPFAPPSKNWEWSASTRPSFFSITSSIATTMSAVNGLGRWKLSSENRNTGFFVRYGVSGVKNGTVTM